MQVQPYILTVQPKCSQVSVTFQHPDQGWNWKTTWSTWFRPARNEAEAIELSLLSLQTYFPYSKSHFPWHDKVLGFFINDMRSTYHVKQQEAQQQDTTEIERVELYVNTSVLIMSQTF